MGVRERWPPHGFLQLRRLHEQHLHPVHIERHPRRLQALVPGGMQLDARLDILVRHARQRQKRGHRGHGRETKAGPYLHGRAHGDVRLGAPRGRYRGPGPRGQPKPHVEGHAVPGGAHLEVDPPRERVGLDLERG